MKNFLIKLFAISLLALSLAVLLCACGESTNTEDNLETTGESAEMAKDIVIFESGEYKCEFIYPILAENEVTELRNEIRAAFKDKTGVTPSFKTDDKSEADSAVVEVLFGLTNRPESAFPEGVNEGSDAFYRVAVVGNKVVINGSDPYQLSLATKYFIDSYLSGDKTDALTVKGELDEQKVLKDYSREYWSLYSLPAYPAGTNKIAANIYNCGGLIKNLSSGGVPNDKDVKLHYIENTSAEEFAAYASKLEECGYVKEFENNLENNLYATYYNGEQRAHISFNPKVKQARVALDTEGMSLSEFGYSYTPKAGEQSEFYQYGIPMSGGGYTNRSNCGMLLIIKCADNSVIIVDGGDRSGGSGSTAYEQMTDEALAGLDAFLREITGAKEGEKVRISAWYITHYHNDHTYGFYYFLNKYGDSYTLERVIANIPTAKCGTREWDTQWYYKILMEWKTLINAKYPDCKEIKVHAGQKIQIADVNLQVLYTHEDLLTSNGFFNSTDSNDTSTVIRVDNGKMSMLVIGDANTRTESVLRLRFTTETLKSDIMTAAHHMIYHLPNLYKDVAPTYFFISQSEENCNSTSTLEGTTYKERFDFIKLLVGDKYYCAGNETVGLAFVDGELKECYYKEGVIGR